MIKHLSRSGLGKITCMQNVPRVGLSFHRCIGIVLGAVLLVTAPSSYPVQNSEGARCSLTPSHTRVASFVSGGRPAVGSEEREQGAMR